MRAAPDYPLGGRAREEIAQQAFAMRSEDDEIRAGLQRLVADHLEWIAGQGSHVDLAPYGAPEVPAFGGQFLSSLLEFALDIGLGLLVLDDMEDGERCTEPLRQFGGALQGGFGTVRQVRRHEDVFDHASLLCRRCYRGTSLSSTASGGTAVSGISEYL